LTKDDNQGGAYARARLDGKLANIANDVSAKVNDDGLAKRLISREEVSARHPYGRGFDIVNYARLIFAMNNLPPQFFGDAALTKRLALVHFDQQIQPEEIDTNFTESIIKNELPGVLNWIIDGLNQLLQTSHLNPPPCCIAEVEQLRTELDPLSAWLAENGYQKGKSSSTVIKTAYTFFVEFCKADGYQALSKKTFTKRLRDFGYEVSAPNNHVGLVLWFTKSVPEFRSPDSLGSPPLENKGETGEQTGSDAGSEGRVEIDRKTCSPSLPIHSPLTPPSGPANIGGGSVGDDGSENSEQVYVKHDCQKNGVGSSRRYNNDDYFATIPGTRHPKHGCDACWRKAEENACTTCPWIRKSGKLTIRQYSITVDGVTYTTR
jgi:phage/plasmid-associated DNA primase